MLLLCFLALPVGAQNEKESDKTAKSVEMKEVTVEAARVTNQSRRGDAYHCAFNEQWNCST